ncbi:hypothetical protein K7432_002712 [Basidiobolus ranarum]|uniref:Alpha-N-acetylglucosaminidase n=1 Tax=Basidiobolus ranarum TaxID=34480 RepID=A0ABR2X158_9FUNG
MLIITIAIGLCSALTLTQAVPAVGPRPEQPLYDLVQRLLPAKYQKEIQFSLKDAIPTTSTTNVHDVYRITTSKNSKIVIEGDSLSALGAGLNYYLRNSCQVEMSWSGDRFNELPSNPPTAISEANTGSEIIQGSIVPWRYYMNVVTAGYSTVFWDWQRWEREIDWMVLNGINMPLALTGQEYITRQLYLNLGLSLEEISSYFVGAAFQPWNRMGNIQGSWGFKNDTGVKNGFIDSQFELQKKILQRMKAFGMTPILPSFQSFVPSALVQKFPNTTFHEASQWSGMPLENTMVHYVDPQEPLFATLAEEFIKLQKQYYGENVTDHYILDLYNELLPASSEPEYLKSTTKAVVHALRNADKNAVWVMQGWFLTATQFWTPPVTKSFFDGIREAEGKAFIIDLYSDGMPQWKHTDGFYGMDWGWSMINNFAGGQGIFGVLPTVLTEPFAGYHHPAKSMKGMGVTPDGINTNEFLYHLIYDLAWKNPNESLSGKLLLDQFIQRRYGAKKTTPLMLEAWDQISKTLWNITGELTGKVKSYLDINPKLNMEAFGFEPTVPMYDTAVVADAWKKLIKSTETKESNSRLGHRLVSESAVTFTKAKEFAQEEFDVLAREALSFATDSSKTDVSQQRHSSNDLPNASDLPLKAPGFRFDVIDVTREVLLITVLPALHKELVKGFNDTNAAQIVLYGSLIEALILDTDKLLSTHSQFHLGKWLGNANAIAKTIKIPNGKQDFNNGQLTTPANYLEFQARNQITWWGPASQGSLADYASKQWAGLVKTYYLPRWQHFSKSLLKTAISGQAWNQDKFNVEIAAFEGKWQYGTWGQRKGETWGPSPKDDTVEIAQDIFRRWGKLAIRISQSKST